VVPLTGELASADVIAGLGNKAVVERAQMERRRAHLVWQENMSTVNCVRAGRLKTTAALM
jgi:hypothetical protein